MVLELNQENFKSSIAKGIAVIDFWAPWCGPCKQMTPVIEKLAQEQPDLTIGKLDIDEAKEIAQDYNVLSIPTVIIFKDGEDMDRIVGVTSDKKIMEKVNSIK